MGAQQKNSYVWFDNGVTGSIHSCNVSKQEDKLLNDKILTSYHQIFTTCCYPVSLFEVTSAGGVTLVRTKRVHITVISQQIAQTHCLYWYDMAILQLYFILRWK